MAQLWPRDVKKFYAKLHVAVDAHEVARASEKGQPYTQQLEGHGCRLLSTSTSVGQCRSHVLLYSNLMLHGKALEGFGVPSLGWFIKMRESAGLQSWVYAVVVIAGAEAALQYGYDETQIG